MNWTARTENAHYLVAGHGGQIKNDEEIKLSNT